MGAVLPRAMRRRACPSRTRSASPEGRLLKRDRRAVPGEQPAAVGRLEAVEHREQMRRGDLRRKELLGRHAALERR